MNRFKNFKLAVVEWKSASIICMLFMLFSLNMSAKQSFIGDYSQFQSDVQQDGKRVTVNVSNKPIRTILNLIKQQTNVGFIIDSKDEVVLSKLSLNVTNYSLEAALGKLLANTGYKYTIKDSIIIIEKNGQSQKGKFIDYIVTGMVTDAITNEELPGATIVVEGTYAACVADAKGMYMMPKVSSQTPIVLVCSFMGYEDVRKEVKASGNYNFSLRPKSEELNEVVITTGYQEISKNRMTGAVSVIDSKEIENKGYASVGDILRGALPGVSVRLKSGTLGAEPEIRVRGLNSLYGSMDPLFIVDGVPFYGSLNDIIPEDIESITVLKDAAATSIYGSQAANGVIVIKRKRGQEGQSYVNVSASLSLSEMPTLKLDLMNTQEKIAFERTVYEDFPNLATGGRVIMLLKNADLGKISHQEAEAEIERLSHINTNWFNEIFKPSFSQNYVASYSGGTAKTTYYATLSARLSRGAVPTNKLDTYSASLRISHKFNKVVSFALNMSSNLYKNEDSYTGVDMLTYGTFANPYEAPYDENGNYAYDRSYESAQSTLKNGYKTDFNIIREMKLNKTRTNSLNSMASMELGFRILDNLQYRTIGSIYQRFGNTETILTPGTATAQKKAWVAQLYPSELPDELNNGSLSEDNSRGWSCTWQNRLEYRTEIKGGHYVNLFAGHEVSENSSNYNYVAFPEYEPEKGLTSVPLLGANSAAYIPNMIANLQSIKENRSRSVSFFANASYSYLQKYVFSTSIRFDGADIIGTQNRFTPLWNASLRYNITQEKFMKDRVKWINNLAVRFSYGYTGSIDRNALPFNVLTFLTGTKYYDEIIPSYIRPKNPSVKWQKKQDRSLGLETSMFNSRVNVNFNYYNNIIRDLLDQKNLPMSVGMSSMRFNSSTVQNVGWEFDFNTVNVRTRDFSWRTYANFSANKSKVLKSYYKSIEDVPVGSSRTEPVEGTSTNSWFGYKYAGIDPLTGHTLAFVDNSGRAENEYIGFQREDGMWVLDMDDQANSKDKLKIKQNLGKSYPPIAGGFGTSFSYKNWGLNSRFVVMLGHKITSAYYSTGGNGTIASAARNVLTLEANRWRKVGDITDIPRYNSSGYTASLQSDMYDRKLEDGSFVKCSEISLEYHMPASICKKMHLRTFRINLNLRDLYTFTNYKGLDPENFGGYGYPNSRKYMLSLNIGL